MNLWLRLLWLFLTAGRRPAITEPTGASVLPFRVMPHDLDISLHLNNGRYWTLMDLGRIDMMMRLGLWQAVTKYKWQPVVSAATIRFRRELRLWQSFRIETRIVAWARTLVVIEQKFLTKGKNGQDVLSAVALVRAGLYDRKAKAFVPMDRMMGECGFINPEQPPHSPEVEAFLHAEDTLRQSIRTPNAA